MSTRMPENQSGCSTDTVAVIYITIIHPETVFVAKKMIVGDRTKNKIDYHHHL